MTKNVMAFGGCKNAQGRGVRPILGKRENPTFVDTLRFSSPCFTTKKEIIESSADALKESRRGYIF